MTTDETKKEIYYAKKRAKWRKKMTTNIIGKEEVYDIIEQTYILVKQATTRGPLEDWALEELRSFCDLLEDQVARAEGAPYELNWSEDYYIKNTTPKKEQL